MLSEADRQSSQKNLTRDIVRFLIYASSGSSLPEADRAEIDIFIQKILQLLPALGIHQFSISAAISPSQAKASNSNGDLPLFHIHAKGVTASGRRSEERFTVLKGSLAVKVAVKACSAEMVKSRENLLEKSVIGDCR